MTNLELYKRATAAMLSILKKCLRDEKNRRKKLLNKSTAACYSDDRMKKMENAIFYAEEILK